MKSFVIPDIYCPFPSQISPHLEHIQRHTVEWVQRLGLVQKETDLQRFLEIAGYACRTHPQPGLEELIILSDCYCWVSLYDDQLDESELGRRLEYIHMSEQHLLAVFQPSPLATHQEPIVQALFDVWQRIGNLTSSAWQRRFAIVREIHLIWQFIYRDLTSTLDQKFKIIPKFARFHHTNKMFARGREKEICR